MHEQTPEGFNFASPPPIHRTYQTPQGPVSVTEAAHLEYGLMALRISDEENDSMGLERDPAKPVSHLYIVGKDEMQAPPVLYDEDAAFCADVSFASGVLIAVSCSKSRAELAHDLEERTRLRSIDEDSDITWEEVKAATAGEGGQSFDALLATKMQDFYVTSFGDALKNYTSKILPQVLWSRHSSERLRNNHRDSLIAFGATAVAFGAELVAEDHPTFAATALTAVAGMTTWVVQTRKDKRHFEKLKGAALRSPKVGVVAAHQLREVFDAEVQQ